MYILAGEIFLQATIVLTLAWACRPAIMLPSMQKAVTGEACHYGPVVIPMGRSSEKAFGVSIHQQGSRRGDLQL